MAENSIGKRNEKWLLCDGKSANHVYQVVVRTHKWTILVIGICVKGERRGSGLWGLSGSGNQAKVKSIIEYAFRMYYVKYKRFLLRKYVIYRFITSVYANICVICWVLYEYGCLSHCLEYSKRISCAEEIGGMKNYLIERTHTHTHSHESKKTNSTTDGYECVGEDGNKGK